MHHVDHHRPHPVRCAPGVSARGVGDGGGHRSTRQQQLGLGLTPQRHPQGTDQRGQHAHPVEPSGAGVAHRVTHQPDGAPRAPARHLGHLDHEAEPSPDGHGHRTQGGQAAQLPRRRGGAPEGPPHDGHAAHHQHPDEGEPPPDPPRGGQPGPRSPSHVHRRTAGCSDVEDERTRQHVRVLRDHPPGDRVGALPPVVEAHLQARTAVGCHRRPTLDTGPRGAEHLDARAEVGVDPGVELQHDVVGRHLDHDVLARGGAHQTGVRGGRRRAETEGDDHHREADHHHPRGARGPPPGRALPGGRVPPEGLEPPTNGVETRCSLH